MDKKILTSLTSVIVSGLLAAQGLPASAQVTVQTDNGAQTQSAAPADPPPASEHVNVPFPAPSTVVTNVQSGEVQGGNRLPGRWLMISGGSLFGVTYLATVIGSVLGSGLCQMDASLGCREASWPIYLPVIGPFLQMGYLSGNGASIGRAVLAIDGVLQAGGLAMFITGAVLWSAHGSQAQYARRIQLVPSITSTGTGLLALGRF